MRKQHRVFIAINLPKDVKSQLAKYSEKWPDLPAKWANREKSEELSDLKNDLQDELVEVIDYRAEHKGFAPHITLARISEWMWKKIEPEERPEVSEDIDFVFLAESVDVMESELRRGGPAYIILESCELK